MTAVLQGIKRNAWLCKVKSLLNAIKDCHKPKCFIILLLVTLLEFKCFQLVKKIFRCVSANQSLLLAWTRSPGRGSWFCQWRMTSSDDIDVNTGVTPSPSHLQDREQQVPPPLVPEEVPLLSLDLRAGHQAGHLQENTALLVSNLEHYIQQSVNMNLQSNFS